MQKNQHFQYQSDILVGNVKPAQLTDWKIYHSVNWTIRILRVPSKMFKLFLEISKMSKIQKAEIFSNLYKLF